MPKITVKCNNCEKDVKRWPSKLRSKNNNTFCSKKCYGKYKENPNQYLKENGYYKLIVEHDNGEKETVLFNEEDYTLISKYHWHVNGDGYASTGASKEPTYELMHHLIMGKEKGKEVDHINANRADNRRDNLRIVTRSENMMNRIRKDSDIPGITWREDIQKWRVRISKDGKRYHLGSFESKNKAIAVRRKAERKYHGEYSYTVRPI